MKKSLNEKLADLYTKAIGKGIDRLTWHGFDNFLRVLRDDGFELGNQFGEVTFADGTISIQCAQGFIQFSKSADVVVMEAVWFEGDRRQVFTMGNRWPLLHELCEPSPKPILAAQTAERDLPTRIDFRTNEPQKVRLFGGVETITFVGVCPISRVRLYESDGSNDPRGPLGKHAVDVLVANEYGMEGPDVAVAWVVTNERATYDKAVAHAKSKWTEKALDNFEC